MIPSARATALRSTALATSLALAVGLAAFPLDARANPKVPLPKPRPIARTAGSSARNAAACRPAQSAQERDAGSDSRNVVDIAG